MLFNNTVVNFHQITNSEWLERVFVLLKKHYRIVSAKELEEHIYGGRTLRNSCHITFDDGDESFYYKAYPVIKKLDIPVSIYVSPRIVLNRESFWFQRFKATDKKKLLGILLKNEVFKNVSNLVDSYPPITLCKALQINDINEALDFCLDAFSLTNTIAKNMDVSQLLEVSNSGLVEVGAHTITHPILLNETDKNADWEISTSVSELEAMLSKPVNFFAYPNGRYGLDFSQREVEILKTNGIKIAFTTDHKGFTRYDDPLRFPRKSISSGGDTVILMKLIMGNKWDSIKKVLKGKDETDYRFDLQQLLSRSEKLAKPIFY